ncbi:MAG: endonuclease III [Candidatus Krumholzibacteria bacterium]|nr:endonuclease III [Candidatus Krumholzibacteria bacterium]
MPANKRKHAKRSVDRVVKGMSKAVGKSLPTVSRLARRTRDPFKILISTLLSLRTKDEVTMGASQRLFAIAHTAEKLSSTPVRAIEKAIYPVGFYKTKARSIKEISKRIAKEYDGIVPDSIDALLELKGVGRKTANLVVTLGYGKDGICVDTHVHRVSNRLGLVKTKTVEQTEFALMDVLPRKFWIGYNELLVSFGQKVCKPISPLCSTCPLHDNCPQLGVEKHR